MTHSERNDQGKKSQQKKRNIRSSSLSLYLSFSFKLLRHSSLPLVHRNKWLSRVTARGV